MHLSAASVAVSIGETVNAWTDSSSGMKNFEVLSDCVAPVLGQASWDSSIPVLDFGYSGDQNCLKSVDSHDVPVSATLAGPAREYLGNLLQLFRTINFGVSECILLINKLICMSETNKHQENLLI